MIDGKHEQYTLALGMMHALRIAVGRHEHASPLGVSEFMSVDKYVFPPGGNNAGPLRTPPHPLAHTFKFKDYSPRVFRELRELSGVDNASYMLSICGNNNYIEFIPNSKSGQFFFYSHDGSYMIKTQTPEENRFLRRILPFYYQHLKDNPNSMMTRFFGMHRVKMYHLRRKVHFVIMKSVFSTTERIHTIYDLKGSRVGRSATPEEKSSGGVLKDNDLVSDGRRVLLGPKRAAFLEILRRDVAFLQRMRIMDYSLLLGIHDRSAAIAEEEAESSSPLPRKRSDTPLTRAMQRRSGEGSPVQEHRSPREDAPVSVAAVRLEDIPEERLPPPAKAPLSSVGSFFRSKQQRGAERGAERKDERPLEVEAQDVEDEEDEDESLYETEEDTDTDAEDHAARAHPQGRENPSMRPEGDAPEAMRAPRLTRRRDGGVRSRQASGEVGGEVYFMGIIDILQQYNLKKRTETSLRSVVADPKLISAVDPKFYGERFLAFIDENTE